MSDEARQVLMTWNWDWTLIVGPILILGSYLAAIGPLRSRFPGSVPARRGQIFCFLAGSLTMLFALASPLDAVSDEYLFSAHMVQHLLLTVIGPPLVLVGTPGWMLRPFLRSQRVLQVARFLTGPIVAFFIFNINFFVWHVPAVYDLALENERLHIIEHLTYMATALITWWPVLSPLPELPRLSFPGQIVYLFLQSIPATVLGALLAFNQTTLYAFYEEAPHIFGLNAYDDQVLGGAIMAGPACFIFLIVLSVVFFKWAAQEERRMAAEAKKWS